MMETSALSSGTDSALLATEKCLCWYYHIDGGVGSHERHARRRWQTGSKEGDEIMAWYEKKTCAVCGKIIGRRRFWQQGPRLVGPGHSVHSGDPLTEAEINPLLASHRVVCASCFYDRLNEARALVEETKPS